MKSFRFYSRLTAITMGKLCQRRMLLAGLTLLCLLLPLVIGPAAETVLSDGVSFSGITLAVTAPEGDSVPETLEQVMSKMTDIGEYCEFRAMESGDAKKALERGEVTAILELPQDFVQGILNGENPDVGLIVSGERPLEAMLTLWVGQSASDLLSAFQSGIYAVLELYRLNPPDGMSYSDAVTQINLRYINWTMNRQEMFRTQSVSASGQLPIRLHYGLSLLAYLLLSLAPLFVSVYNKQWISSQRRLLCAGRGELGGMFCTVAASSAVLYSVAAAAMVCLTRGSILHILAVCLPISVFCASFAGLCCLLTADIGSCGALSFSLSAAFLAISGGIVPPVMLPASMQRLMELSPITWLRSIAAVPSGDYPADPRMLISLVSATVLMLCAVGALYLRRCRRQEAGV